MSLNKTNASKQNESGVHTNYLKHYLKKTEDIEMIMSKKIFSVSKRDTILHAATLLKKHKIGALLILEKGRLAGILSERDIITRVVTRKKNPQTLRVEAVMTSQVFTARCSDSFSHILNQMQKKHIRHVPVVNNNDAPIGIVSARDLMTQTQTRIKHLTQLKNHYMTHDALTGLRNYRFFNDYLDIEIARSLYYDSPFSLLSMDLDHFKELNDTAGHPIGNLVLMRFGELLSQKRIRDKQFFSLRKSDVAVRFGGDEFSLILPDTTSTDARACGERVLTAVRVELNKLPGIKMPMPLSISIGIATFPTDAQNRQTLIKNSDLALYEAKKRGKDQICVYGDDIRKTKK